MDAKKLIIIPEDRPLYALRKSLGPERGPIIKPIPVTVSVIGELLMQTGNEKLTIYEVLKCGKRYTKEVQLTLDNYTLPYNEILNGKNGPAPKEMAPAEIPVEEVAPEVIAKESSPAPAEAVGKSPDLPAVEDNGPVELSEAEAAGSLPDDISIIKEDPYAGMSRKQRKAAMRAAKREERPAETGTPVTSVTEE